MSRQSSRWLGALVLGTLAALVAVSAASAVGPKGKSHGRQSFDVNATASARSELAGTRP